MSRSYWVYIMTNRPVGTLYIGVTKHPRRRIYERRQGLAPGFTQRYQLKRLVYFKDTTDVHSALAREKQLGGWIRARKVELIERTNPGWRDLYDEIVG